MDQPAHFGARSEILERRIGQVLPLGPVADRGRVDRDDRRDEFASVAEHHRLADIRAELELVLDELRGERGAVGELADVARPVDDDEMAAPVDVPGVAGNEPAVGGQRRAALLGLLVIPLEHAAGSREHLAVVGDPHLDPGKNPPDGFGIDLAVGLRRAHPGQLGGAVNLLQIDPDRAKEAERVGAERRAAGIDEPGAAQPELVAQRPANQDFADRPPQAQAERRPPAFHRAALGTLGDRAEMPEQRALQPSRIRPP